MKKTSFYFVSERCYVRVDTLIYLRSFFVNIYLRAYSKILFAKRGSEGEGGILERKNLFRIINVPLRRKAISYDH